MVSEKEQLRRLEICRGCPMYRKFDSIGLEQCTECKCVLGLKAKLRGADCPQGKW